MAEKRKILIVEDEEIHLDVIKAKLEIEGFEVLIARDGEEGERLIGELKPDLVLLDVLLPKKNGLDVLEDLQKEVSPPPVIIISNSGQPVEVDKALNLGAADYLIKANFTPEDVLAKVRSVLMPSEKKSPKGPLILIIEDDKFLRDLIVQKLAGQGFNVRSSIGAEEAFNFLEENTPQLILLDLILPGLDGFEILSQLKAKEKTRSIPVIVLSNLGQQEDIDRAMGLGAADYMVKANFTPGEIVAKIKNVLQKKYL